jgi:TatD DNase family protein
MSDNYFIDSHAHIYASEFDADRDEIIERCHEKEVGQIFMPNVDETSIDRMLEAEERYKGVCVPMMGLHPCSVDKHFEKKLYIVEDWLKRRKFSAIGEIGIDLYHDTTYFEQQKEAFRIQVRWAMEYQLAVIIHCRNSFSETLEELLKIKDNSLTGIFHCFSGSMEDAEKVVENNFYLGIGGVVTFKNGGLDKVLPGIDVSKLVLETDSPYLAPAPDRGKRNNPAYIPLIAEKIAQIKNVPVEKIKESNYQNCKSIFRNI